MPVFHNSIEENFVQIAPELTIGYSCRQGLSSMAPVIFIHGYSDSRHSFDLMLPGPTTKRTCYWVDLRGHGLSSKPACGYGLDDFAGDLVLFQQKLDMETAIVVGHSLGAMAALRFAAQNPNRVEKLVLMGCSPDASAHPLFKFLSGQIALLKDHIPDELIKEIQMPQGPVSSEFLDLVFAQSRQIPYWVWQKALDGLLDSGLTDTTAIEAETLILWGEKDGLFNYQDQLELKSKLKKSRLEVCPGAGHALHWEAPDFTSTLISELISVVSKIKTEQ